MLRKIWNPAKKQALIITNRASSSSPPSSLSSPQSSSSSPSCLMGSQMVDKWPSPLNLRSSAASCTAQLSNIVEGCNDPVLEDKILELVSDETDGGNVDLSCLMQSNCPEPYESHNRAPSHLNMPGGGLRAQDKYLASEIHDVFAYERLTPP